jgi:hypothetical protein
MTSVGDIFWDGRGRQVEVVWVQSAGDYLEQLSKRTIALCGSNSSLSKADHYSEPSKQQQQARAREVIRMNKPRTTGTVR